ncbi:MAG TPA: phasin family protein [Rhodocyclaceae bacterium]|nr:phasin family protein [Rhodocyclaceae bacterium]
MVSPTKNEISNNASALTATLVEMSQLCLSSLERLSALNLNTMRQALEESMAAADRMSRSAGNPAAATQTQDIKPLLDRSVAYSQNVMEICTSTHDEAMRLINSRIGDFKLTAPVPQGWASAMDTFARSAQEMATMGAETVLTTARATEHTAERVKEQLTERGERHAAGKSSHRAA